MIYFMPPKSNFRVIPALFLLCLITFLVGVQVGSGDKSNWPSWVSKISNYSQNKSQTQSVQNSPQTAKDLGNFWQVWDLIHNDHIDRATFEDQAFIDGAIKGMVEGAGDPYTVYLPVEKNVQFNESLSGRYSGIGAELGMEADQLLIVTPIDDTPAFNAGLLAGDLILEINGEPTQNLSIPDAVKKIRGTAGTSVKLKILHKADGSQPQDVTITRSDITIKSVKFDQERLAKSSGSGESAADFTKEGIAYIRMSRFGDDSVSEWNLAVNKALADTRSLKAVILDLRNNPGGYLNVAIELGGDFVGKGTPIVIQENSDGTRNSFTSNGQGRFINVPVIVLVNEGSASASEILAATLREDRTDVTLVGKKTYGKGTVQEKKDLPDGSGVNITVAKWLTPKGTWVHKVGIMPDVEVTLTPEDITAQRDTQLMKALEIARGKIAGK